MYKKQGTFQTISWFYDLYKRGRLDLDPPYQRRSVWNQQYKDYFVDTIILNYPCPPIFLYEEIDRNGIASYSVVDGKQRLTTLFDFIDNKYPVFDKCTISELCGKYFNEIGDDYRIPFFSFNISIEFLPTNNETIIKDIFQRLNKNIAKLTPQELRHARFEGEFITAAEDMTAWMDEVLHDNIPRFARNSINKMLDVEFVSQLLLLIDEGVRGYTPNELDKAYSGRDEIWDNGDSVIDSFKKIILIIKNILDYNNEIKSTRIKNQADFYGLVAAINENISNEIDTKEVYKKLMDFYSVVEDADGRVDNINANSYFTTVRTNTNKTGTRIERTNILKEVLF